MDKERLLSFFDLRGRRTHDVAMTRYSRWLSLKTNNLSELSDFHPLKLHASKSFSNRVI